MQLVTKSPKDEWVVGNSYRMSYDVKIPVFLSAEALQAKVDTVIQGYATDPRLRVIGYHFERAAGILHVDTEAIAPASPIEFVAYALVGIAALAALTFTLRAVAQILDAGTITAPGGFKLPLVPILVVLGAWLYLRRTRP